MGYVGLNKLSLLDFPNKISAIIFTNSCNFYCPFCHNGLTLLPNKDELDMDKDILPFLMKRKGLIEGVVISGGEPTLCPSLIEDIKKIKALGYKIKLDTNGSHPEIIKKLVELKLLDYIAMDVKNSLSRYEEITGNTHVDISKIKESIDFLKSINIDYEFRTTLIKEFHNEEAINELGELLKGSRELNLQKFVLSDGVINKNLHEVEESTAKIFQKKLNKYINNVNLRGY